MRERFVFFLLVLVLVFCSDSLKGYAAQKPSPPALKPVYLKPASTAYQQIWPEGLTELQLKESDTVLTVTDILNYTLTYHPVLEAAMAKLHQAEAKLLEKQGAFDVKLSSGSSWNRYQSSSAVGKPKKTFETINKLAWQSRSGLYLSAGNKLVAGDVSSSFSPTGDTGDTFIEARLPLLKGLIRNKARAGEQQAELQITESEAGVLKKRLELLQKAGNVYWKWFTAGKSLEVTQNLTRLAEVRYKAVKRQAELGDKADIDRVEAEQELRRREALLAQEESKFLKAAQDLSLFVWDPGSRSLVSQVPAIDRLPVGLPKSPLVTSDLLENGKVLAYQAQPDLKILGIGQKLSMVDWRLAKNQLLPQLDAIVRPGIQPGTDGIGPTLRAGVELSVPLQRRSAKGQLRYAQFRLDELDANERLLLAAIQVDVAQAVIGIEQAEKQLSKTGEQVDLAIRLANGEQRRFDLGDSTLFLVNTRERQAAKAQKDNLEAVQTLMLAWLEYWISSVQL